MMVDRGKFITFEGGEGAGKSTQVLRLSQRLQDLGIPNITTREPGGSPGAEAIRDLLVSGGTDRWSPMTEVLLNFAARQDHIRKTIEPALASGAWVLCDRFADSTVAYQGYGHGLGADTIHDIWEFAIAGVKPDFTLIFDMPVGVGLERAMARGDNEDRYERMGHEFHERLRKGFLEIQKTEPDRCVIINAADTMDRVGEDVFEAIKRRFPDAI